MITSPIIIKPVISEKSFRQAKDGIYTFIVKKYANKAMISREIEKLLKVNVTGISTQITKGKQKLVGRKRQKARKPDIKKARLKLKKGQTIEIFETGMK